MARPYTLYIYIYTRGRCGGDGCVYMLPALLGIEKSVVFFFLSTFFFFFVGREDREEWVELFIFVFFPRRCSAAPSCLYRIQQINSNAIRTEKSFDFFLAHFFFMADRFESTRFKVFGDGYIVFLLLWSPQSTTSPVLRSPRFLAPFFFFTLRRDSHRTSYRPEAA